MGRGANQQASLHPTTGPNLGFSQKPSFGGMLSKPWATFQSHREVGSSSVTSLPLSPGSTHCVKEPPSLSDPSILQSRASVPRAVANPIEVPAPPPSSTISQAANEIFSSADSGKAGPPEAKVRKISKEKLKTVLTTIDNMEDEVNYDPYNLQHISSSTNPGTTYLDKMSLLCSSLREDVLHLDSETTSPISTASLDSCCSNGMFDLATSIFSWKSYESFSKFCAKIGINLRNSSEAEIFLNNKRRQQSLSPIYLEESLDFVELYVYNLPYNYDYIGMEY